MAAFAGNGLGVPSEEDADKPSTVRTIYVARLHRLEPAATSGLGCAGASGGRPEEGLLALDLVANAFLPQMIRTIVGTLLEVGAGKRTVESIKELIESRDRANAGPTARPRACAFCG